MVDSAVYCDGRRVCSPATLADTYEALHERSDGMAWIGLYRPDDETLHSLAGEFDLHPLSVEDAITAHQRPKLERYGDTLFVVLRAARYLDDVEEVAGLVEQRRGAVRPDVDGEDETAHAAFSSGRHPRSHKFRQAALNRLVAFRTAPHWWG